MLTGGGQLRQNDVHPVRAALWMLGAVASFSLMAVAGRELAGSLDTFEIMMYRSFVGIVIVGALGFWAGTLHEINTSRFRLHLTRNLFHFAGQNLWFYAVALIPFAQLFAFEFSVPLWVALLAPFFLAERLTPVRILVVCIGFIGILLVAKPGAVGLNAGVIAAFLCAFGFAGAFIATKLLARTASTTCILFWLTVMQAILGLLCTGYDGDIALPDRTTLPLVLLVGVAGLLAHYCITTALKLAPAVIVTPMDFVRLPLIAVVGWVYYNEPLDMLTIVGVLIVLAANFGNIFVEHRQKTRTPTAEPQR